MAESVMRQGMKTWLKEECQQVGISFLFARDALRMATEHITELQDPIYYNYRKKWIESGVNSAVDSMVGVSEELLPVEDRMDIFNIQKTIKEVLEKPPIEISDVGVGIIQIGLHRLRELSTKYLLEKVVECQIGKPEEVKPTALKDKWYDKGVEAGKTDTWMDIENTIKETAERHPEIKDAADLIFEDVEQWKQTDHYQIKYGRPMWDDVQDSEIYPEVEVLFWDGYVTGRKQIGKDILGIAEELVSGKPAPTEWENIPWEKPYGSPENIEQFTQLQEQYGIDNVKREDDKLYIRRK